MIKNLSFALVTIVIIAVLLTGFFLLLRSLSDSGYTNEVILPMLAIAGVIFMLAALALVSVWFARYQLQDRAQALGLPEGSIRAVIALSLIILFAILTVYLYGDISADRPSTTLSDLTLEQQKSFLAELPKDQIIGMRETKVGQTSTYTIMLRGYHNSESDDFAKQILVLLGTLVTSIASFYFGSKAGAAGAAAVESSAPAPLVRSIDPTTRKADGSTAEVQIQGDNLGLVKEVKIVSGNKQILATDVLSNDSNITCKLAVAAGTAAGTWDVIVTDSSGKTSKLRNGLTVAA